MEATEINLQLAPSLSVWPSPAGVAASPLPPVIVTIASRFPVRSAKTPASWKSATARGHTTRRILVVGFLFLLWLLLVLPVPSESRIKRRTAMASVLRVAVRTSELRRGRGQPEASFLLQKRGAVYCEPAYHQRRIASQLDSNSEFPSFLHPFPSALGIYHHRKAFFTSH